MLPKRFARSVQRGFTVPEVLAVVAIIMIILSILLPSFKRARSYALQTLCAANQRNWGTALRSYANMNRGFFPDNRYASDNDPALTTQLMNAAYPPSYRSGYHISWNSSVVQKFWTEYLTKNNSVSKTNEHDVLNCPTQAWHQDNDINLAGGLVGYFYMPGRSPDAGQTIYTYAGNGWVFKDRFSGPDARAPIMSDMKQWHPTWGWINNDPNALRPGNPYSSHARASTGEAEGGNFLFEDGHVTWYMSDTTGDPSPTDPNDIMQLGATIGGWRTYYKIPLN